MDYVFFAFSALSFGFAFILVILLTAKSAMTPRPMHLLLAGLIAALYFYLEITYFGKDVGLYYLSSLIPHGLLLILLGVWLMRRRPS